MPKKVWTQEERAAFARRMAKYRKKRKKNPGKFDRCVRKVKKSGTAANAYAVCNTALKRKRRRAKNPVKKQSMVTRIVLQIKKGAGPLMNFDGQKFSSTSRGILFADKESAYKKALELVKKYPVLEKYHFYCKEKLVPKY